VFLEQRTTTPVIRDTLSLERNDIGIRASFRHGRLNPTHTHVSPRPRPSRRYGALTQLSLPSSFTNRSDTHLPSYPRVSAASSKPLLCILLDEMQRQGTKLGKMIGSEMRDYRSRLAIFTSNGIDEHQNSAQLASRERQDRIASSDQRCGT
jgi:hypothetical protein